MNPLLIKNHQAGAALTARQLVKFSADGVVVPAAAGSDAVCGVTGELGAASGDRVDVIHFGLGQVRLGGTVTRGDMVYADSSGYGLAAAGAGGVVNVLGQAFLSGVSGDIVPCSVLPHLHRPSDDVYVANVTLTAAQVKALNATPITVVAAPGAGLAVGLVQAVVFMDYGSVAYDGIASGEDLALRYTNGSGAILATVETTGFLDATADAVRYVYPTTTAAFTPAANAALVAHMTTGEIATGDSPVKIRVYYRLLPTTL